MTGQLRSLLRSRRSGPASADRDEPNRRGGPPTLSRRDALRAGGAAAAALAFGRGIAAGADTAWIADHSAVRLPRVEPMAAAQNALLLRTIPRTGERIPAIGLGTESSFSAAARNIEEYGKLRRVLESFSDLGGRVVDAAPSWDPTERVLARLTRDLGSRDDLFWAAKISIRASGGRDAGLMQFRQSAERLGTIALEQIQDLLRWEVQLPFLQDLRSEGRIRYVGVTTSSRDQHELLERILAREDIDFVQLDYAIDNRDAERALIPMARDRGIAILVNSAFRRGALFQLVGDRPVPQWAGEFGASTWAQFFLKWVLGNDAVTAALPGTSDPLHLRDNMRAGVGRLPDPAERTRMAELMDTLTSELR